MCGIAGAVLSLMGRPPSLTSMGMQVRASIVFPVAVVPGQDIALDGYHPIATISAAIVGVVPVRMLNVNKRSMCCRFMCLYHSVDPLS